MIVEENLKQINEQIIAACKRVDRKAEEINIVAVTKYVSVSRAQEAVACGIIHLAENRLEGAMEKYEEIGNKVHWHFIGNLQSRKVKGMIHAYEYIHSLDRLSLAKELNKRVENGAQVKCFVQVNVSGEETKSGIHPDEVIDFISSLEKYPAVKVIGLMTMAPHAENPEEVRPVFSHLRKLRDQVQDKNWPHAPCRELSMGMSNDFEIAIEEGATFIRLGTSLVGAETTS